MNSKDSSTTTDLLSILDCTSKSSAQPQVPYESSENSDLVFSETTHAPSKAATVIESETRSECPEIWDLVHENATYKGGDIQDQTETSSNLRFKKTLQKIEERLDEQENVLNDQEESIYLFGETPKLEYEVRGYQAEIYMKSRDRNSIIVLETGSGKTIISILHILESLRKYGNTKMVAFLNLQINLVEQQARKIQDFLKIMENMTDYEFLKTLKPKVVVLHGGKGEDTYWDSLWKLRKRETVQRPIILVMTPQFFLNGLRRGYIRLEKISLIVFDECHHCKGNFAYNHIMQEFYHRPLKANAEKPQILGLTATPITVTKDVQSYEIEAKLLEICNNLDSNFCTLDDINDTANPLLMKKSEAEIETWTFYQEDKFENLDIASEADHRKLVPLFQNEEFLMAWDSTIQNILKYFDQNSEQAMSKNTRMSVEDYFKSKIANRAIALLLEFGEYAVYLHFQDVHERLKEVYEGLGVKSMEAAKLTKIKEILQQFLKRIQSYNNPKLITHKLLTLLENLKKVYVKQPQNTGIVFIERKYMARVLNTLINEMTPSHIKARYVIGHNFNGLTMSSQEINKHSIKESITVPVSDIDLGEVEDIKREGKFFRKFCNPRQTLPNQLKQIDLFKKGDFNVLIATSIIQEGFDVPNCNFVISYSEPKTLLGMVQMRGRARKEGSKYYILVSSKNESEKRWKYEFGLELMKKIKTIAKTFEKNILSRSLNLQNQENYEEEISESGGRLNMNWSDYLTMILCKSVPPNSWEKYKPFFFLFEEKVTNKNQYTCMIMLPNQCNLRMWIGETYPNKADAKRSAAFKCCQRLIRMGCFTEHLVPKSLNKDQVEFINLQIDPLANSFDSKKIEAMNDSARPHNFSHFAKQFQLKIDVGARTFSGYVHKINFIQDREQPGLKIYFVHSSKLPDKFSTKDSPFLLEYSHTIEFTVEKYQEYMLIHRYLTSFVESSLPHFFSILTDEPANYFKFDQQVLDDEYQSWISHKPSISFFMISNENFYRTLKEYITYQSRIYQYVNSLTYDRVLKKSDSVWSLPQRSFICNLDPENFSLFENVVQDFWGFRKYQYCETQELKDLDLLESSDGRMSLQSRIIFKIDPFLGRGSSNDVEDYYSSGFKMMSLEDGNISKIFIDTELMVSPISVKFYKDLELIVNGFKNFDQSELSLRLYREMMTDYPQDQNKVLRYDSNPVKLLETLDDFADKIYKQGNLFSEYIAPHGLTKENILAPIVFKKNSEIAEIEESLKDIFTIEKYQEDQSNEYAILGAKLIELLLTIEVLFKEKNEWDYSLERARKYQIQRWKDENDFIPFSELFISEKGNELLCNAIITETDRDGYRMCAEYLTQKRLSEVVKITSYMFYDKEKGDLQRIREFLKNCGLLKFKSLEIETNKFKKEDFGGGLNVMNQLYSQKYNKLERILGYQFKDQCLLISAFMEISFRDYLVEWVEKKSDLFARKSQSLLEIRKKRFAEDKGEFFIPVDKGFTPDKLFSRSLVDLINYHHETPNELDRLRFLGQALVQLIIAEWIYEKGNSLLGVDDMNLEMQLKYFTCDRFITCVSWYYNLEGCMLAHSSVLEKLKGAKAQINQKDLITKPLYGVLEDSSLQFIKLCVISSNLFLFIDWSSLPGFKDELL